MIIHHSKPAWVGILATVALSAGTFSAPASADVGTGSPVRFDFGTHPKLGPTLRPSLREEDREATFTAKGYFKIAGKTVARLPAFKGTASTTPHKLSLVVSHSARHTIRASAKRHHAKRVTLTIVTTVTPTDGTHGGTYTNEAFLTIVR